MAYNYCKDINKFQAVVFNTNCPAGVGYLHEDTCLIFKNLQINIRSVDTQTETVVSLN